MCLTGSSAVSGALAATLRRNTELIEHIDWLVVDRECIRIDAEAGRRHRGSGRALMRHCLALGLSGALATSSLLVAGTARGSSVGSHLEARHARASTVAAVERLLGGIPQSGIVLGDRHAPVTLQVFGDLECPICREFALHAEVGLIRRFVRTGKLKIESRSLETATREPRIFLEQQVAALAAGRQDKLWYFTELFYREQGLEDSDYVNEGYLRGLARQVPGLDLAAWEAARSDPMLLAEVASDTQRANRRRFTGTPSFLIGRTGGHPRMLKSPSLERPADFEAAIERLLRVGR